LSRIEVGSSYPSLDTVDNISRALNVEMKELFVFTPEIQRKEAKVATINLLDETDDGKLKLILKIVRAIVR